MAFDFATLKSRLYSVPKYNTGNEFDNVDIMTGAEFHSNFRELANGELDLNTRLTAREQSHRAAGAVAAGLIPYNGNQEGGGLFYGGTPLVMQSTSPVTVPITVDENNIRSCRVAEGSGIKYNPDGSINTGQTIWYDLDFGDELSAPNSFATATLLATYLNTQLTNTGIPFAIKGTADILSIAGWAATFSWGTDPVSFFISVDDAPDIEVILNTTINPPGGGGINGAEGIAAVINTGLWAAGIGTKVEATVITESTFKYLQLSGLNNRPSGCSRIKITKNVSDTNQILEKLGLLTSVQLSKTVFDFSTTFQFVVRSSTSIDIQGLNSYSKLAFLGSNTGLTGDNLFNVLNINIGIVTPVIVYHTALPALTDNYRLNFGGDFYSRALYATDKVYANGVELTSSRKFKTDIKDFTESALHILSAVQIKSFKYVTDTQQDPKVGFIAEDTHPLLSTPRMDSMDVMNSIGLIIKGLQELTRRVEYLESLNKRMQ